MAALGQDLLDCITALGYGQAILVGHDWGAAAADAAALAAPDSTSHLITCAVPYSPSVMHALATNSDQQRRSWYMFFFQTPLADQAIATNDFELIKRLWQEWAAPHWQGDPATLDAVLTCFRQPGITGAALAYYRQLLTTPPPTEYLPITCPALYIHGDQDGCIGIELATPQQQFYSRGCDFMAVAGAGHFVHLEKPAQFNQRVAEFIAT